MARLFSRWLIGERCTRRVFCTPKETALGQTKARGMQVLDLNFLDFANKADSSQSEQTHTLPITTSDT